MEISREDLLLSCAVPVSEAAWQRQCEFAQRAMTHYLMQRCKDGHSAHAQLYGGVIALAAYAKPLFSDEGRGDGAQYMIDAIKAVMLDDQDAASQPHGEGGDV